MFIVQSLDIRSFNNSNKENKISKKVLMPLWKSPKLKWTMNNSNEICLKEYKQEIINLWVWYFILFSVLNMKVVYDICWFIILKEYKLFIIKMSINMI